MKTLREGLTDLLRSYAEAGSAQGLDPYDAAARGVEEFLADLGLLDDAEQRFRDAANRGAAEAEAEAEAEAFDGVGPDADAAMPIDYAALRVEGGHAYLLRRSNVGMTIAVYELDPPPVDGLKHVRVEVAGQGKESCIFICDEDGVRADNEPILRGVGVEPLRALGYAIED